MSTSAKFEHEISSNYHHGNLRAALVADGLSLLKIYGNSEFTLRELAKRLGVTANAAYRHFASKDDLLTAIAAEGFRMLLSKQAEKMQESNNPKEGFIEAGKAYITFARNQPALFRLMFGRFSATSLNEEIRLAAQFAYEGMRYGAAAALQKPVEDTQVTISAAHAWSIVHGLSNLIIDGQFDSHTKDLDSLINEVLAQAAAF